MPEKEVEEVVGITPISNTLVPRNKYFRIIQTPYGKPSRKETIKLIKKTKNRRSKTN